MVGIIIAGVVDARVRPADMVSAPTRPRGFVAARVRPRDSRCPPRKDLIRPARAKRKLFDPSP